MLQDEEYDQWVKMRSRTIVIFTIETVLIGMDFSLTFLTLWLYIRELVETNNPKVYYSLISASFLAGSLMLSAVIGRVVDRYRNVRTMFFVCNTIAVFGNLIYTLHFSPWLLVVGRLLSGMSAPLRSVMSGEIARSYSSEDLPKKLSIMGIAYSFGFVAGPAFNFVFKNTKISIYSWVITQVNIAGIYMALLFFIIQIMSYFMLFDLSKIFDLKKESTETAKSTGVINSYDTCEIHGIPAVSTSCRKSNDHKTERSCLISYKSQPSNFQSTLVKLFTTLDTALLLFLAFIESYIAVSLDLWKPLLIIEKMGWSNTALNVVVLGEGISCVIPCIILIRYNISDKYMYFIVAGCMLSFGYMEIMYMWLSYFSDILILDVFLWVIFCVLDTFLLIVEEVFLVGCLANMVGSSIQVFSDGVRLTMYRLGSLLALTTSALVFDQILIVGSVHLFIIAVCLVGLYIRRKSFSNQRILIYQ